MLLGFARALRAAGVPVTQDRTHGYLAAVSIVGLGDARATYTAGRATLCASPDDLARYDQIYEAYFNGRDGLPRVRPAEASIPSFSELPLTDDSIEVADDGDVETVRAMASDVELLRHRDIGELSAAERHRLASMFATLRPRHPQRRRPVTSAGTAAPSTPRAPCARACGGWASPPRSSGDAGGTSHAGSCC